MKLKYLLLYLHQNCHIPIKSESSTNLWHSRKINTFYNSIINTNKLPQELQNASKYFANGKLPFKLTEQNMFVSKKIIQIKSKGNKNV